MTILFLAIAFAIICFLSFIIVHNSNRFKGIRGEKKIAMLLGKTRPGSQYLINDLLFSSQNGASCQIDHIFINPYGIWVIETKNYAGKILGGEEQTEWTQVLAHGRQRNKFYNPIKQNASHIYQLSKLLQVKNIFHNVVVFLSEADISGISSPYVYHIFDLSSIKSQKTNIHLSQDQMEQYYNVLLSLKNNPTITRKEHIKNIKKLQKNLKKGICPRCGGKLVIRQTNSGKFYGCSNFPSCKFTKSLD